MTEQNLTPVVSSGDGDGWRATARGLALSRGLAIGAGESAA